MPVLRLDLVLDTSALTDLKTALQESPRNFYAVVNNTILPIAQRQLDALLNKPGDPTGGHYQFSTYQSQKYYFATHKVPYKRTGNVLQWRVILKAFTGQTVEISFENPVPYAKYVFGSPTQRQVIGHIGRWLDSNKALVPLVEFVLNNLAEAWIEAPDFDGQRIA